MTQLSEIYRQKGGRFMCCRTPREESSVKNYIVDHQSELITHLSPVGVYRVTVDKSRNRSGDLGRFIISFRDASWEELCHFTLVCEDSHWSQQNEIREPHFTIGENHYFYTFDKRSNTLIYRKGQRSSQIPTAIVKAMERMLSQISPDACPIGTTPEVADAPPAVAPLTPSPLTPLPSLPSFIAPSATPYKLHIVRTNIPRYLKHMR